MPGRVGSHDVSAAAAPSPDPQAIQRAVAEFQRGNRAEAERICRAVLSARSDAFDALHLLGIIAAQTARLDEAEALFARAVAVDPGHADAHNNRGNALRALGRLDEALASYERAVALRSGHAAAHNNRGTVLQDLRRLDEAVASYDRALALRPGHAGTWSNRGRALQDLGRHAEALASYDRALALEPGSAEAWNNRGTVLYDVARRTEAVASYERALALDPGHGEAWNNRAVALRDLGRHDEALASCDRAIALKPRSVEAEVNRGNVLRDLRRHAEALASYARALQLDPGIPFLYGDWLHTKMQLCDWSGIGDEFARLAAGIERREPLSPPFTTLVAPCPAALQRVAAETWVRERHPPRSTLPQIADRVRGERIRVGYFSADFHAHATSFLAAELFERHDRARFETTAFSFGPDTGDTMRARVAAAFDAFVDVGGRTDAEVAALARERGIDVAVDLKGYTQGGRPGIFALRAAPIQASYLGYPGTMGAPYIDYLVADATLVPDEHRRHYAERIAYLPHCYQPNDTRRAIAPRSYARGELDLPAAGFVFCCFNNSYKILPELFARWMRILRQVDGSVLWLLRDNAEAEANLRVEAGRRGVDAGRLVFADRIAPALHLARHRCADLFLDTLPCNAHTTASDALWAGLPVLTILGDTFAGRVAASLLRAVGLPELVAADGADYEALAIALATDPARLRAVAARLAAARASAPLFDAARHARHLEAAFAAMVDRHRAGLPPEHIHVAP
jgi:predicted O-linked N-acetylglucosamine transferase (SPINDLY family)